MEEVRQIQDDAVSSNDINNGNILNNLTQWDVNNMATPAFNEIYACAQEDDDDDVLPFEGLLDTKSNDANNVTGGSSWIDTSSTFAPSSSNCENLNYSLPCVERDDFRVIQSLSAIETVVTNYKPNFTLEGDKTYLSNSLTILNKPSLSPDKSGYVLKMSPEVVFLNAPRIARPADKVPMMSSTISRNTFESCINSVKNNFTNEIMCFNPASESQNSFNTNGEDVDCISKSIETSEIGNLTIGDTLCMDGPPDVFAADESSNSFLDNNHSTDSSNLSQYATQLVYADISGSTSKEASFQNSAVFINQVQLQRSQQNILLNSEIQQNILNQHQPHQPPSIPMNQHFILHQTPQVITPQLQTSLQVLQQLKMPQQLVRTTFQKNLLESTSNLLPGQISLNKSGLDDQQLANVMVSNNMKQAKPQRNRNQTNRSTRTDAAVSGKPNTTGPTNEKDSQELERVMNILKHYKQQIASNDQESQFLPCKRKRSKPPENILNCTSAGTSSISNLSQSKLVTSAVIPNLNLSFSLPINPLDSKIENASLTLNQSVSVTKTLSSTELVSTSDHNSAPCSATIALNRNIGLVASSFSSSSPSSLNSLIPINTTITTNPILTPQCSQVFPFSPHNTISNAMSRAQLLLSSLQNNISTTLQLSMKSLAKLVVSQSTALSSSEILQSSEPTQPLTRMPTSNTPTCSINSNTLQSQPSQQILNVSQAFIRLQQLNSNQKVANPQQIILNSFLQKNLPQLLQLSIKEGLNVSPQPTNNKLSTTSSSLHTCNLTPSNVNVQTATTTSQQLSTNCTFSQPILSSDSTSGNKIQKCSVQVTSSNVTLSDMNHSLETSVSQNHVRSKIESCTTEPSMMLNNVSYIGTTVVTGDVFTPVSVPALQTLNDTTLSSDQSGTKLNSTFSLTSNKVKQELSKKLKTAPVHRTSLPIASTFRFSVPTSKAHEHQTRISEQSSLKGHGINYNSFEKRFTKLLSTEPKLAESPGKDTSSDILQFQKSTSPNDTLLAGIITTQEKLSSSLFEQCTTLENVKDFLSKRFNVENSAIRIEQLEKSGSNSDTSSWDPTSKSILKRTNFEEKILCLVTPKADPSDQPAVLGLVLWEGLEEQLVSPIFDCLSALFQVETERKRKVRGDKPSNLLFSACNVSWNIEKESCDLKVTSYDHISKQERIKESSEVVHQLSKKVSNLFDVLVSDKASQCSNDNSISNAWTEATLLSNNNEELNSNADKNIDVSCYVPLSCRANDESVRPRKDLGIWRVFPGCILSKIEENKEKKIQSCRNKSKAELLTSSVTEDHEHSAPQKEAASNVATGNSSKFSGGVSRSICEKTDGQENTTEVEGCWAEKNSGRRKRKSFEAELTLKLKIKKLNPDNKDQIEKQENVQDVEDDKDQSRQQRYYCVRPRRQKSQRQIEHEQLQQQQKLNRISNSRTRQRTNQQQKSDEDTTMDAKGRNASKSKEATSKVGDTTSRMCQEDDGRIPNKETRARLTMKLRDKITPRTRCSSGVFMTLTRGSIYFELSNPNIRSTSLTNCSTNQLCLRLQSRSLTKSEELSTTEEETKTSCSPGLSDEESAEISLPTEHQFHKIEPTRRTNSSTPSQITEHSSLTNTQTVVYDEVVELNYSNTFSQNTFDASLTTPLSTSPTSQMTSQESSLQPSLIQSTGVLTRPTDHPTSSPFKPASSNDKKEEKFDNEADVGETKIKCCLEAPVNCAVTMTTDTLVTKWIKPKLATTGPYQCWD